MYTYPKLLVHANNKIAGDKGTITADAVAKKCGHVREFVHEHLELGEVEYGILIDRYLFSKG